VQDHMNRADNPRDWGQHKHGLGVRDVREVVAEDDTVSGPVSCQEVRPRAGTHPVRYVDCARTCCGAAFWFVELGSGEVSVFNGHLCIQKDGARPVNKQVSGLR